MTPVLLFTYGTLQQETVQLEVFGRKLKAWPDELHGFERRFIRIPDEESGTEYPILYQSETSDSIIKGTLYEIEEQELLKADAYEGENYRRIRLDLKSGKRAWVYIGV
ncbi:MAG: gamma-glutamylcyclotransferase family protein [Christiangramia sp.]|uniref:gamma-glutamylcyclotransferase family protein n=1 Tax=Christiangramia sp. TaxID=1931228 RepID=UPI003242409A